MWTTADDRPFVARAGELEALSEGLEDCIQGRPRTMLVAGDAGVGKSSLLRRFLDLANGHGAWSMYGACLDHSGERLPYGPIRDALRTFARDQIDTMPKVIESGLSGLLPELTRGSDYAVTDGDPLLQQRLLESMLDLMAWAGQNRPLVAVFEDLHWADPSSLACLSFLNSNFTTERILMIGSYRTDELSRGHRLLGWMGEQLRKQTVQRLEVKPFGRAETEEMIAGILKRQPSAEIASRVYERSEGNAFFVEELAEAWVGRAGALPSSLREVLLARVAGLSDDMQATLRTAAVGGRVISLDLLTEVIRRTEGNPKLSLREAVDRHVIASDADGALSFRHALLHEVFLSEVLPGERERIHVAYAQALEGIADTQGADPATMAQIAHHWYSARDTKRALVFSVKAADAAISVGAFDVAQAQYERAVSLWEGTSQPESAAGLSRAQLLGHASNAAHLAGNDERAIAFVNNAITQAKGSEDPSEEGLLYGMLGWYEFSRGPSRDAFKAYERALELIPAKPSSPARARVLAEYARLWMLYGAMDKAKALAEEALTVARSVGALREEALALDPLGMALAAHGELEKGLTCLRRAVSIAREVGDFEEELRSYMNLGEALFRSDDLVAAISIWLEGSERAWQTGLRERGGSFLLCNICQAQFESGDWVGMEKNLREAERWLAPPSVEQSFWLSLAARLALCRGEFDRARRYLQQVEVMAPEGSQIESMPEMIGDLYRNLVELAVWEERYDDGRELAERALIALTNSDEIKRWGGLVLMAGLRGEADRAQALVRPTEADATAARERGAALVEVARTGSWDPLSPEHSGLAGAVAATCRGELQRLEGTLDPESWANAAAAWANCGRPYDGAYALWRQAEAHALTRNKSAAYNAFLAAHDIAQSLGARPLLHELKMLAQRARLDREGIRPEGVAAQESPEEDRLGLTEREIDVLRQIALGRTNREIGAALFISPKTAGVHVSHILAKLGVRSRVAAAGLAHRLGLLDE